MPASPSASAGGGSELNLLQHIWELRDRRMDNWPLMSSPLPTVAVCCTYFYCVKFTGPQFMAGRRPFDLRKTIIAYNFLQVSFSTWILCEILAAGWAFDYSLLCEPLDRSMDPKALRMANAAWWYFFSKFTEFLDTAFFILRKKDGHVSALHVIHHGIMPLFAWEACRFVPGGHESFGALFNTFVHVIMYAYYFLAALGPSMQKHLWWKRHLTKLQLLQCLLVMLHSCPLLVVTGNPCGFPLAQSAITFAHGSMFFALFVNFYARAYLNGADDGKKKKTAVVVAARGEHGEEEVRNGQVKRKRLC